MTAAAQYSEYEVKAAYIFNFAKFIEWPDNYIDSDTLYLCVYKNDPFGIILEKTIIPAPSAKFNSGKIFANSETKFILFSHHFVYFYKVWSGGCTSCRG